jgi:hypothetical protein
VILRQSCRGNKHQGKPEASGESNPAVLHKNLLLAQDQRQGWVRSEFCGNSPNRNFL